MIQPPKRSAPPSYKPLFLERETYRRNRLADAARLLPILGAVLLLFPDLLLSDADAAKGATAPWLVYFFMAWGLLIALAFALSRKLTSARMHEDIQDNSGPPEPPGL